MKIVQVQTQAEAGGAQRVSDMVGEGLRARGHEARTVFMYRKTDVYDRDPFADFVLRERPRGLAGQVRATIGLAAYLRRERPDVVISYQHYGNIFGTLGARFAGVRHVIANQSGPPYKSGVRGVLTQIDRLMGTFGLYQQNVVNSGWTEAQFEGFPEAYRRRLRRIDHGVAAAADVLDKQAARAAFGLPEDAWLAVSTGRQTRIKNHVAIVGAMARLPAMHVALAGVGPEHDKIVALAEERGVTDRLHFVGEVPPARVFEFLAAGDVYAFPSTSETFGLAVVEAAIAGLPVVASGLPVLREVLTTDDGEAAALFVSPDPEGMAGGLSRIMEDPEHASALASAGRRLASKYSPDAMSASYEKLFLPA